MINEAVNSVNVFIDNQPLVEDDETDGVGLRNMNTIEGEKENESINTIKTPNAENAADPDHDQIDAKNRREVEAAGL
ncbi:hypothetical protein QE152_g10957 [Popillia japonica]|uniref:Uncharacterized protein n=1 Tax=Popillia japonica TaxID=7064 RepID=A0AAW1LTH8_POPJA